MHNLSSYKDILIYSNLPRAPSLHSPFHQNYPDIWSQIHSVSGPTLMDLPSQCPSFGSRGNERISEQVSFFDPALECFSGTISKKIWKQGASKRLSGYGTQTFLPDRTRDAAWICHHFAAPWIPQVMRFSWPGKSSISWLPRTQGRGRTKQ